MHLQDLTISRLASPSLEYIIGYYIDFYPDGNEEFILKCIAEKQFRNEREIALVYEKKSLKTKIV